MSIYLNFIENDFKEYKKFTNIFEKILIYFTKRNIIEEQYKNVSLILLNSKEIQEYNSKYRNLNKPTDVLSFKNDIDDELGDILINIDFVEKQSKEFNHSIEREISFLFIHSLLHLSGYDHDNKNNEEKMNKIQKEIIDELGILR